MLEQTTPEAGKHRLNDVERRFCFAAWPQTFTHESWFELLDQAVGMRVSRTAGREVGAAEQAVASALLNQAGASASRQIADHGVPLWAMQSHVPMRRHLSLVAARVVLPALKLAVSGAQARQWDAVLGAGVRHAVLLLGSTDPQAEPPSQAVQLRRLATEAASGATPWEAFCFRLALAALQDPGAAVLARIRLAWPVGLRNLHPLALEDDVLPWLIEACQ